MAYNLTFMETSNTVYDVVEGVNTTSEGLLVTGFLIVTWILIANYAEYSFIKSGLLSSFITTLVAFLLYFADLLSFNTAMKPLMLVLIFSIAYFFTEGGN